MRTKQTQLLLAVLQTVASAWAFVPPRQSVSTTQATPPSLQRTPSRRYLSSLDDDDDDATNNDEARRWQQQADALREQIRSLEQQLNRDRPPSTPPPEAPSVSTTPTLSGRCVLVVGANGRLGSMVCRYLLRNFPRTQVVAAVHTVGENSPTARGYGRLQYEVGAEDGRGRIGPAWSAEDRTATFEYDANVMDDYHLNNIRIVPVELLDPLQCRSVCDETIDAVIWCATDFNGNLPRAISGLNVAFLFRAVSRPTKGRVEVEGLENMLGAFKLAQQERQRKRGVVTGAADASIQTSQDPVNFVLVSVAPDALDDFETPFGSFLGIKKQGENLLKEYPSITSTVLQMARYEDNFVEEGLDVLRQVVGEEESPSTDSARRRINRRDAAKAVADALLDHELIGRTAQIWTANR